MQAYVPLHRLFGLLLFNILFDGALISIEFVFLGNLNTIFEVLDVWFKAVLNDGKEVWVDIIRGLLDESEIKDEDKGVIWLAEVLELWELLRFVSLRFYTFQFIVFNFFELIFDVMIGDEFAFGELCDLYVSFPLVLNREGPFIHNSNFMRAIFILPV